MLSFTVNMILILQVDFPTRTTLDLVCSFNENGTSCFSAFSSAFGSEDDEESFLDDVSCRAFTSMYITHIVLSSCSLHQIQWLSKKIVYFFDKSIKLGRTFA